MIRLRQLGYIDHRMREIYPDCQNEFFGGRSIILMGDFFQLPPVMELALFSNLEDRQLKDAELKGRLAYRAFDKTIELREIVR